MCLFFYPRGGSAQVARYLGRALVHLGWQVELCSGSLGSRGDGTHARTFFLDENVNVVDYTAAFQAWAEGAKLPESAIPFQPSYEHREGVPDKGFDWSTPPEARRLVDAWKDLLIQRCERYAHILHLHHLGPLQMAAEGLEVPKVTHLHGTELKFVDRVERGESGPNGPWWVEQMRRSARASSRIVCISSHDRDLALNLLRIEESRVTVIPNGVDTNLFRPGSMSPRERLQFWRHVLVDDPRGWDESGKPGSVRYSNSDLEVFGSERDPAPILIFVGRFLAFKKIDVLLDAFARARSKFFRPVPLVVWGGFPGEWERVHPVELVRRNGIRDVFFSGWRGHDDLPTALGAADLFVAPSVGEPFGQVYLEAMACGLPVVAAATGGPLEFVNTDPRRPNGWLARPDDPDALAAAMVEAVNDAEERAKRGEAALATARRDWSWDVIAGRFASLYESILADG
jgi:D-inositol-3-phosphate glycosyltransferase